MKREYSAKQSWREFRNKLREARSLIPLFTLGLLITKIVLYCLSWLHIYTANVEPLLINEPNEAIFGH